MVAAIVGAVAVLAAFDWFRRRKLGARVSAATSGARYDVPAKLRLRDPAGRWREGVLMFTPDAISFRPRRPRVAATLSLTGSQVVGTRPAAWSEKWWFSGPTVLRIDGPRGEAELGFPNDELNALARAGIESRS
jgi:hypothetical protein